jgi:hypothetical protein
VNPETGKLIELMQGQRAEPPFVELPPELALEAEAFLVGGDGRRVPLHGAGGLSQFRRSTLKTQRAKARQAKAMAKRAKRAANRRAHRQK